MHSQKRLAEKCQIFFNKKNQTTLKFVIITHFLSILAHCGMASKEGSEFFLYFLFSLEQKFFSQNDDSSATFTVWPISDIRKMNIISLDYRRRNHFIVKTLLDSTVL